MPRLLIRSLPVASWTTDRQPEMTDPQNPTSSVRVLFAVPTPKPQAPYRVNSNLQHQPQLAIREFGGRLLSLEGSTVQRQLLCLALRCYVRCQAF